MTINFIDHKACPHSVPARSKLSGTDQRQRRKSRHEPKRQKRKSTLSGPISFPITSKKIPDQKFLVFACFAGRVRSKARRPASAAHADGPEVPVQRSSWTEIFELMNVGSPNQKPAGNARERLGVCREVADHP